MDHDGLRIGMFLGGLLLALVPVSISIAMVIWVVKQGRRPEREEHRSADPPS